MPTNDKIKPSLKEKLYREMMFHEGDPEQSVFPDAVSMDTANERIKLAIDKTESAARADTAKQIFAELDKITRVYPNELYEQDVWVIFTENKEYQTLKKKYKVD